MLGRRPRPPSCSAGSRHPLTRAATRGKPRYVRWRSPQSWFRPGDPGLPNRDAFSAAPPPRLAPGCIVRIDVHGSKDRAKDASHRTRVLGPVTWCPRFHGVGRRHSPPRRPSDIRCHRRVARRGRKPAAHHRADRGLPSSCVPRRTPPSSRPECLSPSRHAKESLFVEGLVPSGLRVGSPAHAAHTWSSGEGCAFLGIARSRCGHPRVP